MIQQLSYMDIQPIHHINFDINLLGDCDVIVAELARRAGWTLDHKMIPEGQEAEVGLVGERGAYFQGGRSEPCANDYDITV